MQTPMSPTLDVDLEPEVTEEIKRDQPPARAMRRAQDRYRDRRRAKGQKAFTRQQLAQARQRDDVAVKLRILKTRKPGDPIYDNVFKGLVREHGEAIIAQMAEEA